MIELHGRPRSNYYNAVKAVMIEKQIEFAEVIETLPPTAEYLAISPMAKVPSIVTEHGPLTETTVILDYLEDTYPTRPMLPVDSYARAKQRELCKALELYIELVARRGYGVLRGEAVSEVDRQAVKDGLAKSTLAIKHLLNFDPWITGPTFSYADIFAYFMLVYARLAARAHADMDLLGSIDGAQTWFEQVEARPSMQRVLADAAAYAKSQS